MKEQEWYIIIAAAIFIITIAAIYFAYWCQSNPAPAPLGGDRDIHGCIPSAGYSWCEAKQKCLRPWEEACP